MGIQETKDLLRFVIDIAEAVDKSLEDNDFSVFDAANFVTAMLDAGSAFNNMSLIPKELADLTLEEANELYTYATTELNLSDEKVEETVKKMLEIGLKLYDLVVFMKDAKKS
jgi:hypothetical protein